MKILTWCTLLWAILLAALFVSDSQLLEILLIPYLMLVLGGILAIAALIAGFRGKRWQRTLPVFAILGIGFLLNFTSGYRLGRKVSFKARKSHYQALLDKAVRTGVVPPEEGFLQEGKVKRYAFFVDKYVPDGWLGAVYDPSGRIMTLNHPVDAPPDLYSPPDSDLGPDFFSNTGSCIEDLGGNWYLCWFVYRPVPKLPS